MNYFLSRRSKVETKTGKIIKCAPDYFVAFFDEHPNIIANGESEAEVIDNLVFMFKKIRDNETKKFQEQSSVSIDLLPGAEAAKTFRRKVALA